MLKRRKKRTERGQEGREVPAPAGEELSPKRIEQARAMYRSYYTWLRISRLLMGAFLTLSAIYFLWITPWLPQGLETGDYSPKVSFTLYLIVSIVLLGLITLAIREWAWRKRESLMTWSIVYDSATGLHNRAYFIDRLALECDRSHRSGREFSVLVLTIRPTGTGRGVAAPVSDATMQRIAGVINRQTHPADLVGHLGAAELAVLAAGVDRENRRQLLARLRDAVAQELGARGDRPAVIVTGGAATYGVDGTDPATLLHAARTAAALGGGTARTAAPSHEAA